MVYDKQVVGKNIYGAVLQICEEFLQFCNVCISDNNSEMTKKNGTLELNKITTIKEFGNYLEGLRGDISARQVAVGICTPVHLRDIERGLKAPSEEILYRLAEKVDTDAKELIFALRRILAPEHTKGYYKITSNNSIHDVKEHVEMMMKDIAKIKGDIEEIKNMMRELLGRK